MTIFIKARQLSLYLQVSLLAKEITSRQVASVGFRGSENVAFENCRLKASTKRAFLGNGRHKLWGPGSGVN